MTLYCPSCKLTEETKNNNDVLINLHHGPALIDPNTNETYTSHHTAREHEPYYEDDDSAWPPEDDDA